MGPEGDRMRRYRKRDKRSKCIRIQEMKKESEKCSENGDGGRVGAKGNEKEST